MDHTYLPSSSKRDRAAKPGDKEGPPTQNEVKAVHKLCNKKGRKSLRCLLVTPTLYNLHLIDAEAFESMKIIMQLMFKESYVPTTIPKKLLVFDRRPFNEHVLFMQLNENIDPEEEILIQNDEVEVPNAPIVIPIM